MAIEATDRLEHDGGLHRLDPFRLLAASAPVGIMLVDAGGTLGYVNQRCREVTGIEDDEGTIAPWLRAIHPRDRTEVLDTVRRLVRTHEPQQLTCRLRRAGSDAIWVRARLVPAPSEANRRMYAVWLEDVTAERAVRGKVDRLSLVLEQSPDFVTIVDSAGRLVYANATVRDFFGVATGADLHHIPPGLGFTETSQWRLRKEAFPALLADGHWTGELTLVAPDGTTVPILQASELHRDADGNPDFVAGIGRDVSLLKEAELRRTASDARFRLIAQHTLDLVTIIDTQGFVTYASPSHTRVLGYSVSEVLGRSVFDFVHPDDVERARAHYRTGSDIPVEYRVRRRDDTWCTVEALTTPLLHDPAVLGVIVSARAVRVPVA